MTTPAPAASPWPDPAPMKDAPRDGTMLRLLVLFDEDSFEDSLEPCWTIGFNNLANTQEDRWQFAGWDWCHDRIIEAKGQPIGWLPMHDADLATTARVHATAGAERMRAAAEKIAAKITISGDYSPAEIHGRLMVSLSIRDDIRALALPDADALEAVIAEAEARGEEKAIKQVLLECRGPLVGASDGGTYVTSTPDLMRMQRRLDEIRARAGETTDAG